VEALELLHALPFVLDDIESLLAVFHPCASQAATGNLSDICDLGPTYAAAGPETQTRIARWLAKRAPRALAEATAIYPDP
jgi:hypothetical protein